ncbi:hypothetical protein M0R01_03630 [bacterium]|nr:hypothetical protein [bacterium]
MNSVSQENNEIKTTLDGIEDLEKMFPLVIPFNRDGSMVHIDCNIAPPVSRDREGLSEFFINKLALLNDVKALLDHDIGIAKLEFDHLKSELETWIDIEVSQIGIDCREKERSGEIKKITDEEVKDRKKAMTPQMFAYITSRKSTLKTLESNIYLQEKDLSRVKGKIKVCEWALKLITNNDKDE